MREGYAVADEKPEDIHTGDPRKRNFYDRFERVLPGATRWYVRACTGQGNPPKVGTVFEIYDPEDPPDFSTQLDEVRRRVMEDVRRRTVSGQAVPFYEVITSYPTANNKRSRLRVGDYGIGTYEEWRDESPLPLDPAQASPAFKAILEANAAMLADVRAELARERETARKEREENRKDFKVVVGEILLNGIVPMGKALSENSRGVAELYQVHKLQTAEVRIAELEFEKHKWDLHNQASNREAVMSQLAPMGIIAIGEYLGMSKDAIRQAVEVSSGKTLEGSTPPQNSTTVHQPPTSSPPAAPSPATSPTPRALAWAPPPPPVPKANQALQTELATWFVDVSDHEADVRALVGADVYDGMRTAAGLDDAASTKALADFSSTVQGLSRLRAAGMLRRLRLLLGDARVDRFDAMVRRATA